MLNKKEIHIQNRECEVSLDWSEKGRALTQMQAKLITFTSK
jgi:hypothetical protein